MCNNNCLNLQDMEKYRLPEQVLIVNLGLNQPETMLEQNQPFISETNFVSSCFLVFLENCICVIISVQIFRTWTNADFLNKC